MDQPLSFKRSHKHTQTSEQNHVKVKKIQLVVMYLGRPDARTFHGVEFGDSVDVYTCLMM